MFFAFTVEGAVISIYYRMYVFILQKINVVAIHATPNFVESPGIVLDLCCKKPWKKWKKVLESPGIWINFFGGNHGATLLKKRLWYRGFPVNFARFNNSFFTEHLWTNASVWQQLLALYFVIIYSWQLSKREKSSVRGKKFVHIFQGLYRFRFLLQEIFYKIHFLLRKTYTILWTGR